MADQLTGASQPLWPGAGYTDPTAVSLVRGVQRLRRGRSLITGQQPRIERQPGSGLRFEPQVQKPLTWEDLL